MANEIHSLKIGNTEYPIYSEGLKLDTSASNSDYFLTTSGDSGNKKVGISTAIIGNSTSLSLKSDTISIGNGYEGYEPTVIIGDNAEMLYIGGGSTNPVTIHIGAGNDGEAPSNIKMGTPNGSIEIGEEATSVDIGNTANALYVGESADYVEVGYGAEYVNAGYESEVSIGTYGTTVGIGEAAEEVNVGYMSYGVNIGNQCDGNVVIADGSVWTSEDGNEVVEKTTFTHIGGNNNSVYIGNESNNVILGSSAGTVLLGAGTNGVVLGPGAKNIVIGNDFSDSFLHMVTGSGGTVNGSTAMIDIVPGTATYGETSRKILLQSKEFENSKNHFSSLKLDGPTVEVVARKDSSNNVSVMSMTDSTMSLQTTEGFEVNTTDGGIILNTIQGGINISTQYSADDESVETGDLGDINIQSSDGQINLNSCSDTNIVADDSINLTAVYGDVDITSEFSNINISTLSSNGANTGLITIDAEIDVNLGAHGNINIEAPYGDLETTGFVNIISERDTSITSGVGKVNILADTGISLETSNNDIDITSTLGQININSYCADESAVSILADTANGESTASLDVNYFGINLSYDFPPNGTETHINMEENALKLIYYNDTYGGNETIELGTDGTTIAASDLMVYTSNLQIPVPIGNGNTGNPGIKLTHPNSNGHTGTIMYCDSTSQYIAPLIAYSTGSNVNLGTTTKRFGSIFVNAGYATTSFTSSSDERLKDFGDDIAVDLDALAALRKSYYRWNETSGFENEKDRMIGMSAQEVQKIYPEVVNIDDEGMLSMAYDRLSVVALAAIDKLHETNKELKAENDELKERLTRLENLVDAILSRIN